MLDLMSHVGLGGALSEPFCKAESERGFPLLTTIRLGLLHQLQLRLRLRLWLRLSLRLRPRLRSGALRCSG